MISRSDDTDDLLGDFSFVCLYLSMHGLLGKIKCDSSLIIYMRFVSSQLTSQSKMLSAARFAMCDVTDHWSHPQVEGQFMDILKIITITSRRCS